MSKFEFRNNNFDLIRFLAAFQVAFLHGWEHFGFPINSFYRTLNLFPGVWIFFVISGFLISASLERGSSLGAYFKNRILRIYPALWCCFLVSLISVFILFTPEFTWYDLSLWVISQLTIVQFYHPEFLKEYGVGVLNGSLWTIPVELQFYAVLPIFYFVFNKLKWRTSLFFLALICFIFANQFYVASLSQGKSLFLKFFGITLIPYLYMFLIGIILQKKKEFVSIYLKDKAITILILYLFLAVCSSFIGVRYAGNFLNPVSAIVLAILTISFGYSYTEKLGDIFKGNDISYGLYIYHMVIVNILIQLSLFNPLGNLVIMLASTTIVAFLSWRIIEKPALSFKSYSIRELDKF